MAWERGQDHDGLLIGELLELEDFTPIDAHAVHMAMTDAKHEARERAEKMPSSSLALSRRVEALKIARDKILDRLPTEFYGHRAAYQDYEPNKHIVAEQRPSL